MLKDITEQYNKFKESANKYINGLPVPYYIFLENEIISIKDEDVLAVREYMIKRWSMGDFHGVPHWDRVYRNVILLSDAFTNLKVAMMFAYLHDSCRENDMNDPKHGERASIIIDELRDTLLSMLSDYEIDTLKKACAVHTILDTPVNNQTINVCCDADRFDLGRDGHTIVDPNRLLTEQGKRICKMIYES